MRKVLIPLLLLSTSVWAQQPKVDLTSEEREVVSTALTKLQEFLSRQVPIDYLHPGNGTHPFDPQGAARVLAIQHEMMFSHEAVDPRSLPFIGLALSRNSQDPAACALLKKIEPSAVCMK